MRFMSQLVLTKHRNDFSICIVSYTALFEQHLNCKICLEDLSFACHFTEYSRFQYISLSDGQEYAVSSI